MLLSFTRDPEGRQHYGTEIQGMGRHKRIKINGVLPSESSIRCIILDFP